MKRHQIIAATVLVIMTMVGMTAVGYARPVVDISREHDLSQAQHVPEPGDDHGGHGGHD